MTPLSITKLLGTNTSGASHAAPQAGGEGLPACVGLLATPGISNNCKQSRKYLLYFNVFQEVCILHLDLNFENNKVVLRLRVYYISLNCEVNVWKLC